MNPGRLLLAGLVSIYGLYVAFTPGTWHFLDGVDLLFHEAGHLFLTPFGQTMHMLGGTLGQLAFPVIITLHFARRREFFSASVVLFWVAQNCFNISVYARDAVAQQLPLVGGEGVIHDWNWLLSKSGLLAHAGLIGGFIWVVGFALLLASMAGMFLFSRRRFSD